MRVAADTEARVSNVTMTMLSDAARCRAARAVPLSPPCSARIETSIWCHATTARHNSRFRSKTFIDRSDCGPEYAVPDGHHLWIRAPELRRSHARNFPPVRRPVVYPFFSSHRPSLEIRSRTVPIWHEVIAGEVADLVNNEILTVLALPVKR